MKNEVNISNRKAKFDYEFLNVYTAGIQLVGTEVKSIRSGKISLVDSFCMFVDDELYLKNLVINCDNLHFSHTPNRDRKLLLNRKELKKLHKDLIDGLTIIPYKIFTNERGLIKVQVVLARGKKLHDKRETIKNRDIQKEIWRNK
jgi:SsrA-binding protein